MYKYASSYCNSAKIIIESYSFSIPFSHFLKQFFKENKKFGGKDRKAVTQACYAYFRLGPFAKTINIDKAIICGLYLTIENLTQWQLIWPSEWMVKEQFSFSERISYLQNIQFLPKDFSPFVFDQEVSKQIDFADFSQSHLTQPYSFIRIRPGFEKRVSAKLEELNINHIKIDNAIAFADSIDVENIAKLNREIVVQDYSSQQIAQLLALIPVSNANRKVWDCCAASGGKSILAVDTLSKIYLQVSDLRPTILHNLKTRLAVAQIPLQKVEVKDVSKPIQHNDLFDLVIADVPCTGSGTWGRTPENLVYFQEKEIAVFQQLQQKIIRNTISAVKKGGYYLYCTCSVFEKENEANVELIGQKFNLTLVSQRYFKGYAQRADTLFGALFIKN